MRVKVVTLMFLMTHACASLVLTTPQKTAPVTVPSSAIFKDISEMAGLKFQHYNGMTGKFYLPEITGSGGALFDFDNDGDLDVYLVQGNTLEPNTRPVDTLFPWRSPEPPRGKLFRNQLNASGGARRELSFTDVTA